MGASAEMKAGIYSPYWDTLGGGEYYAASMAKTLRDSGYDVDIFSKNTELISQLEERFSLDLSGVVISSQGQDAMTGSVLDKYKYTRNYQLLFVVSDGSVPVVFAKKNILHFQVPFKNVGGKKLFNQFKIKINQKVVCNSNFTKDHIDKEYNIKSTVIYPAVKGIPGDPKVQKQNIILSVGRFDNLMQSKRQDILIEAFKKFRFKGWKLILAGGVLHGQGYVNKLKKLSQGYDIEILTNISHLQLQSLYRKSRVFWHAAGFGLDIGAHPSKAEHFGISAVEAMSAGLVPVVFNGGGLKEIITNKTGYLWINEKELLQNTRKAIKVSESPDCIKRIISRSKLFSPERFDKNVKKIIG